MTMTVGCVVDEVFFFLAFSKMNLDVELQADPDPVEKLSIVQVLEHSVVEF